MSVMVSIDVDRFPALRLSRSQVAQKVGARGHYPRPLGVLVPRPLVEILCEAGFPTAGAAAPPAADGRRETGREVVRVVARAFRRFPETFLSLEMPHPRSALALAIEDRTRNVIERLLPLIGREPTWTVARYLEIPQFGARCLVDLLAAIEEEDRPG